MFLDAPGRFSIFSDGDEYMWFSAAGGNGTLAARTVLTLRGLGGKRVGIGTTNPGDTLDVNGNIIATGTCCSSDDRIKYNEEPVPGALDLIDQLNPQKYEKIVKSQSDPSGTWIPTDEEWENVKNAYTYMDEFGFIAQDVRAIPELAFLVNGDEYRTDTKTVSQSEYESFDDETKGTYTVVPTYTLIANEISQSEYDSLPPTLQQKYEEPEEPEVRYKNKSEPINQDEYNALPSDEKVLFTEGEPKYTTEFQTQTPLALNYQGLFVVAIGAIKELKAKVVSLETQVANLLERVTALESI
jgi:hypothetical protein